MCCNIEHHQPLQYTVMSCHVHFMDNNIPLSAVTALVIDLSSIEYC